MGGGTEVTQATPPQPISAGQSAKEYAAALPEILAAQLQYQPQFDAATFRSFQELAPQYAQVSQDVLNQFSPNQAALGEELAAQALQRSQEGLTTAEEDMFKNTFKSLVGNQVNAPIGADWIAKNLLEQDMAAKQYGQNLGLSLSGKVPLSTAYQQPSAYQVAPSFGQAFGTQTAGQNAYIDAQAKMTQFSPGPDYLTAAGNVAQIGATLLPLMGI